MFAWDNIPGNDSERLMECLNRYFCIDWIKTAEIKKINGRAIKVFDRKNSLSISLNREKKGVKFKINDGRTGEFIVETENGELKVNLLKGKGIERVKNYLKLKGFVVCGDKQWNEINDIGKIRNCIAHTDGGLNCHDADKIKKYIEGRKDIFIGYNEIILGADYCRHVVKIFTEIEYKVKTYETSIISR